MADDIVTVLRSFVYEHSRMRTHSESCWTRHPECAMHVAANEIERLRTERRAFEMLVAVREDEILDLRNELGEPNSA